MSPSLCPYPPGDLMGTRAVTSFLRCFDNASLRPRVLPSPFLALIRAQGQAELSPRGLRALRDTGRPHSLFTSQPPSVRGSLPLPRPGLLLALSAPKSKPTTSSPTAGPAGQEGHPSGPVAALGDLAGEGVGSEEGALEVRELCCFGRSALWFPASKTSIAVVHLG